MAREHRTTGLVTLQELWDGQKALARGMIRVIEVLGELRVRLVLDPSMPPGEIELRTATDRVRVTNVGQPGPTAEAPVVAREPSGGRRAQPLVSSAKSEGAIRRWKQREQDGYAACYEGVPRDGHAFTLRGGGLAAAKRWQVGWDRAAAEIARGDAGLEDPDE